MPADELGDRNRQQHGQEDAQEVRVGHRRVSADVGRPEEPAAENSESSLQDRDHGYHVAADEQAPNHPIGVGSASDELGGQPKEKRIRRNREEPFPSVVSSKECESYVRREGRGNGG